MRITSLIIGLLAVVVPVLGSWSEKDREIFRVRDELASVLGSNVTFYDFLGVSSSASLDDINKAYRKRTRSLHPDKVKQQLTASKNKSKSKSKNAKPSKPSAAEVRAAVKQASDMQARLSIVANILRGPERDRYDHFLTNGFPVWKGTGYYYNRYRPGFGTVLFGLFLFIGGAAHYLILYMSWKRQREFMDRYIRFARQTAWGSTLGLDSASGSGSAAGAAPGFTALVSPPANTATDDDEAPAAALNRRQRRMQERESRKEDQRSGSARRSGGGRRAAGSGTSTPTPSSGPTGAKKRVVAENGKILIVDSIGDVYLEQVDEEGNVEELLLDIETMVPPTVRDTAVYRLPAWLYGQSIGRLLPAKSDVATAEQEDDESSAGKATPSTDSNEEFELLGASTESLGRAQATGNSSGNGKSLRRKGRR